MILVSILLFLIVLLLPLIILLQPGKGDFVGASRSGLGKAMFGGSGGHDVLAKVTWALGFLFMALSLVLTKLNNRAKRVSRLSGVSLQQVVKADSKNNDTQLQNDDLESNPQTSEDFQEDEELFEENLEEELEN